MSERAGKPQGPVISMTGVSKSYQKGGQSLVILQLQSNRQYAPVERSPLFSFLAGPDLASFLNQRYQIDENSLVESFRDWVREQIRATGK